MHIHTDTGMAIGALKDGLRMLSQHAMRFYKRIGYHAYEGITEDFNERERINSDLGKNRAMILRPSGLLTVGETAREAFMLMKTLLDATTSSSSWRRPAATLVEIPAEICAKTAEQFEHHDAGRGAPTGRPICA